MAPYSRQRQHSVTQKDIARHCGVSQMAVSLALRRDPRVSEATTNRVLAVAAELGYDPAQHQAARRMVLKRHGQDVLNHIVAAFVPAAYYRFTYYSNIIEGMLDILTEAQFGLLILYLPSVDDDTTFTLPPAFSSGNIDGAVTIGFTEVMAALRDRLLRNPGFTAHPLVTLMAPLSDCSTVLPDEDAGAYAAARHLLDLGHRHLALFTAPWGYIGGTNARVEATKRAFRDAGLNPETHLHLVAITTHAWLIPTDTGADGIRFVTGGKETTTPLADYLVQYPEITGILAVNDACALHLWYQLRQLGRRVPEDISLVGFDDTDPMPDDYGRNQLTTIHLPLVEIGRSAARHLLDRITGTAQEAAVFTVNPALVVRGSTAAPPR